MAWRDKQIKKWTNKDLCDWVKTIGLSDKWKDTMVQAIKNTGCVGEDWMYVKNGRDLANSFDIKQPMLSNRVFREFKKIKEQKSQNKAHLPSQKQNDSNNRFINIHSAFVNHMSFAEANRLKVNDKIDHRDQDGRFVYGTIVEKQGTKLKIHYDHNGWSNKFDTWNNYNSELHRFAMGGSISKRPAHKFQDLKKGDFVDVNPTHRHKGWKHAEIRQRDKNSGQIQVVYTVENKDYLYWSHVDNTSEIAMYGSKAFANNFSNSNVNVNNSQKYEFSVGQKIMAKKNGQFYNATIKEIHTGFGVLIKWNKWPNAKDDSWIMEGEYHTKIRIEQQTTVANNINKNVNDKRYNMKAELTLMGFDVNHIEKALNTYQKKHGNDYKIEMLLEMIVEIQNNENVKKPSRSNNYGNKNDSNSDESMVVQLQAFGYTREQILAAMRAVENPKDINQIVDWLEKRIQHSPNAKPKPPKKPPNKWETKVFVYESDFDTNGIVYGLATDFGNVRWQNPAITGKVIMRSSTVKSDSKPLSSLVGRDTIRCILDEQRGAWFSIDFKDLRICPTNYSLRHYSSWNIEALRNWIFEGSIDGIKWTTIKKHINDKGLNGKGKPFTWTINNCTYYFKQFRIRMIGVNDNNHNYLCCSGFEIYGSCKRGTAANNLPIPIPTEDNNEDEEDDGKEEMALLEFLGGLVSMKVVEDYGFGMASEENRIKLLYGLKNVECCKGTALRDAVLTGIVRLLDLKGALSKLDIIKHKFVHIVLTDGEDTASECTLDEVKGFFYKLGDELGDLCKTFFIGVGLGNSERAKLASIASLGKESCELFNCEDVELDKVFERIKVELGIVTEVMGVKVGDKAVFAAQERLVANVSEQKFLVLFTLDKSGSMAGGRWNRVVRAVAEFCIGMNDSDILGCILFNDKPTLLNIF